MSDGNMILPEQKAEQRRDHKIFVLGFSMHVLAGTLATFATFLDFNWQSPTSGGEADPPEPVANVAIALTFFNLFYLATNFPATLAWSTSAGWACNTGCIWIFALTGFYDSLRRKLVRVIASGIQSLIGCIALGLAIAVGQQNGFHTNYGLESHWTGSIGLLAVAVALTIGAAFLAYFSPSAKSPNAISNAGGWSAANKGTDESDNNLTRLTTMQKVNQRRCGELGACGVCDVLCTFILFLVWIILVALAIDFQISEPISSCYAKLPADKTSMLISDTLFGNAATLGAYEFSVDSAGSNIKFVRAGRTVFTSLPGKPFVRMGFGHFEASNEHEMGTFKISDRNKFISTTQSITGIVSGPTSIVVQGTLGGFGFASNTSITVPFTTTFSSVSGTNHLAFDVIIAPGSVAAAFGSAFTPPTDHIRLYWTHDSNKDERIFGFGETFNYWDLKGTCMPILTREQGIGRGMQPFTYLINKAAHDGAGSWQVTYSAIPHYVTSDSRSMFLEESFFAVYDLTQEDRITVELVSSRMRGRFLSEATLLDTIEQYTLFSGRMRPLPDWVGSGAIIGLQGGTAKVMKQVESLLENGVPLVGVWLQDWTGKRETSFGDRLLWNWQVSNILYPGWNEMIKDLSDRNIAMLTYINPYLADTAPDPVNHTRVVQPMYLEAKNINCLIKNQDDTILIQISATSDFSFATVDLTNPFCVDWYGNIIRNNMLNVSAAQGGKAYGALGWMADFAESIPFDAKLFAGTGDEVHNKFPSLWAQTCSKAIDIVSGGVNFTEQVTFFSRSAYTDNPKYSTLMWLGDQMQSFNRFDGLETVIPAAASYGLSGFSMAHSDIGGYFGVFQAGGIIQLVRTKELLFRWMELSCFMDSMFRSHEGLVPKVSPHVTSDVDSMKQFARFAKIFKALLPYRKLLIADAANRGYPLARHPVLHYQSDRNLDKLTKQIMLGSELMLCAVTVAGAVSTDCYLPAGSGTWTNFFNTSLTFAAGPTGTTVNCPAPLGRPCALMREGAVNVQAARDTLIVESFVF